MSVDQEIEHYCAYWAEQIVAVRKLDDRLFMKILFVTMLDCWSRAVFPEERRHRERFTRFVRQFSNWESPDRVNGWHLLFLLNSGDVVENSPLRDEVLERTAGWSEGEVVTEDADPQLEELFPLAKTSEVPHLMSSTHLQLLYLYRNHLVHEFREPGQGMELSWRTRRPFYHSMMGDDGNTWELVYPLGFFLDIAAASLSDLRQHLLSNSVDLSASYSFGSPWRK